MKLNTSKSYQFDIALVKELLGDYLYSQNSSERVRGFYNPTDDYYYGMQVYANLKLHYDVENIIHSDIRPLHVLWEHKKLMFQRIKYMIDKGYLKPDSYLDDYSEIERLALVCRNLLLKYRLSPNKSRIPNLTTQLDAIVEKEKAILDKLLNEI